MVFYEHKTVPPISRRMTGPSICLLLFLNRAGVLNLSFHLEVTDLFLSGDKSNRIAHLSQETEKKALPFFSTFLLTISILQYSCAHLNELTSKQTAPMIIDKSRGGKCAQITKKIEQW